MGTGRRLPSRLLAYAVTGLLNFGLSPIFSTKSEVRKDTYTDSLPANDERCPLLSGNTVDAHEVDTKPYEQLSFLESLLPTLSKESRSLIFKLCLFAIDSRSGELEPASLTCLSPVVFGAPVNGRSRDNALCETNAISAETMVREIANTTKVQAGGFAPLISTVLIL